MVHTDAEANYADWRDRFHEPAPRTDDKTVVLACWGNTRYAQMTGDTELERIPSRLRERWYGTQGVSGATSDADWHRLRQEFEQFGWS